MALTLYEIKPRFQALLRPLAERLASIGVTANFVTTLACVVSIAVGATVGALAEHRALFLLLPVWFFARMAANAIDGMLAREFGQKSTLGAYLNELTDVVSDLALYLPFARVAPFDLASVGAVAFAACVSEMAGALAPMVGVARRYDGPMGKSDRALVFGALGLWVGLDGPLPPAAVWLMWTVVVLIACNVINRVRRGVKAAQERAS